MNLTERLKKIRSDFESGDTPQEIVAVFDSHIQSLLAADVATRAVQVGAQIGFGHEVWGPSNSCLIKQFVGERFLILTWFRGNW